MRSLAVTSLLLFCAAAGRAQTSGPLPDKVSFSASLRTRIEDWDWFRAAHGDNSYTFTGTLLRLSAAQRSRRHDWQIEFAAPWLAGLPEHASAPPPEGPLGLGANYRTANGGKEASLFLKQGFIRFDELGSRGNALRLGRFEYVEGLEGVAPNPTVAALKRDRIGHRLLGNFGWSHVGRSLDGLQLSRNTPRLNLTLLAARPTRGVFEVRGWDELDIEVYYAAVTREIPGRRGSGEGRLFWLLYEDHRDAVKVDNRPAAVRSADRKGLAIHTLGGHLIHTLPLGRGTADLLLWGAAQLGDWGSQSHRAGALAAEVGYQPKNARLRPWIRGGVNWGSGDGNLSDSEHNTFFQVLPTPRIYARFPFYNQMNNTDWFAEVLLRPQARWTIRADYHNLRLSRSADLWYQGGGAYQDDPSFGYVGRPSGGNGGLADLLDASLDYTVSPRTSLTFYAGWALGGGVVKSIYPRDSDARLIYLELNQKL